MFHVKHCVDGKILVVGGDVVSFAHIGCGRYQSIVGVRVIRIHCGPACKENG